MAARMRERYKKEVFPALQEKFHYANVMEVPKLEKITLNMGLGDCKDNPKLLEMAVKEMAVIAGQAPVVTKSRKSIANFNAIAAVNDQCSGVSHAQCGNCMAHEVITARAVKKVEFLAVLLSIENGRGYRVTVLLLNGGVVAHGVTAIDGAPAADCSALKEDRLGESSFASALATDERDVLDLVCFVNLH